MIRHPNRKFLLQILATTLLGGHINLAFPQTHQYWQKGDSWPEGLARPVLAGVAVYSTVTFSNDQFIYSYVLRNFSEWSIQTWGFYDSIEPRIVNASHPLGWTKEERTIGTPGHYRSSGTYEAQWLAPLPFGSPAGQSVKGFTISSKVPPGVQQFHVSINSAQLDQLIDSLMRRAHIDVNDFYVNSQEFNAELVSDMYLKGKTVGPDSSDESFCASSWPAHIADLAAQARQLGWIQSDVTLRRISAMTERLSSPDIRKLESTVKELSDYVLAEMKSGRMTEEAGVLVRLNAEYLLVRVRRENNDK